MQLSCKYKNHIFNSSHLNTYFSLDKEMALFKFNLNKANIY